MYKKTIMENGLRLLTYPMPESEAITAQVFFATGSHFEDKSINGISHFLEHLFFKGSKEFPKPGQMHEEVDKVGGIHNAFTGEEITSYFIKASHDNLDLALNILSDALLNPLFPKEEINKERTVILEEMKLYNDDPDSKVGLKFEELLYGDQPAGRPTVGQEEVIRKLQQEDFFNYRKDHYHTENACVVVSGRIKDEELEEKVEEFFGDLAMGKAKSKPKVAPPSSGPKVVVERRQLDQSKVIIGVPAYDLFDPRRFALGVLANALGGTASSRLFRKIREERGLAYSVYSYASQATDTGVFLSFVGTEPNNTEQVIKIIIGEYKDIAERVLSEEELKRAKDNIIGRLGISLETSDRWAGFLGTQEILEKKIMMPEEIVKNIRSVEAKEIQAVAQDIFKTDRMHLAVLGSFSEGIEDRFMNLLSA